MYQKKKLDFHDLYTKYKQRLNQNSLQFYNKSLSNLVTNTEEYYYPPEKDNNSEKTNQNKDVGDQLFLSEESSEDNNENKEDIDAKRLDELQNVSVCLFTIKNS